MFFVAGIVFLYFELFYPKYFFGGFSLKFNQFYWIDWVNNKSLLFLVFYLSFYWFLLSYSFFLIFLAYKRSASSLKNQLKYLILAAIIGWSGAHGELLPEFGIDIYPYSNFLIAIYPFIFAYAIFKHHLLDINLVIKRGLVYSILVAMITIAYILFVFLAERFSQMVIGYRSLVVNLLVIFTVAILFNPIRSKIQRFLDKRFFKGTLESLSEERNRLQQELFHKEKLAYVGQLASSVVHEIKNPLTTLKAFAEFFPEKCHDPAFIEKFRKLIPQEIKRIEGVTNQLLDLSKPREISFQPLNIVQVLDSTLLLLDNNFRMKKININKDFPQEEIIIQGNEEHLRQVFLNLFLNAIQAMEEGGTLTVTTHLRSSAASKSVLICVQDTGIGISEDNLNKLFTPFFTTKQQGIGLGLSISRELIEEHNGKISVESKLGTGTKFTVELPLN